jgi:peptidoglycan/xylan/chitin deacetylase (PgdA/CDA1 family)
VDGLHLPVVKALQFHRITPEFQFCGTWNTPTQFDAFLRFLRDEGIRVVLPGDADEGIVITFDDGERNVYEYAFPILKKYGYKAIVFLVVDYVGKENTWDMSVGRHVQHASWDEIMEMKKSGVEFGSHTLTHRNMMKLTEEEIEHELLESKSVLEKRLGACTSISYPFNRVNPAIIRKVRAAGYAHGFGGRGTGMLTIKKEAIYITDTVLSFATKVKGTPRVLYNVERMKQTIINYFTIATMLARKRQ